MGLIIFQLISNSHSHIYRESLHIFVFSFSSLILLSRIAVLVTVSYCTSVHELTPLIKGCYLLILFDSNALICRLQKVNLNL